jgi:uncharacterized protein (TIGR00255 family)
MAKSMTGYGFAETDLAVGKVRVEVRCLNHKYLDLSVKTPREFFALEPRIRESVKKRVSRGRIDLTLRIDRSSTGFPEQRLEPNLSLAGDYVRTLREMKERHGLAGEVTVSDLAGVRELLPLVEIEQETEAYWETLLELTDRALQKLDEARVREGTALRADLAARAGRVREFVEEIQERVPEVVAYYRDRLRDRLKGLLEGTELDEVRFNQEITYLADRSDISEELVRMKAHLDLFETTLNEDDTVGKRLDFVVQEMNREINTVGAKANNTNIARAVIEIKSELGRIREQVQNIE